MTGSEPPTRRRSDDSLDDRKAAIIQAVVAEYIGTGQAVGSGHVANAEAVRVSSATVRSEMVALEREGYLVQPHTSAGRIPTDKGFRYFVDHLAQPGNLGPGQRAQVSNFFTQVQGGLEEVLERTSSLLSDMTHYASVVVGPSHETTTVISAQIVNLGSRRLVALCVLSDGAVENFSFDLTEELDDASIAAASMDLNKQLIGVTLGVAPTIHPTGTRAIDELVLSAATGLMAVASADVEAVYVGGSSHLAQSFDAIETVRGVLSILEQQLVVVSLLRDVLDSGLSVAIGSEHGYEQLASCAVVVAPIEVEGVPAGAVGLLGPTRMDYAQAMAAAEVVSRQLAERIGSERGVAPSGDTGRG
jgi:heat-inducible transcriptional repressor